MNSFFTLLLSLNGVFIGLIVALAVSLKTLFKIEKAGELKDISKIAVQVASFVIALFLHVMVIPMLTLYFQAYLCEEDSDAVYMVELYCDSSESLILIILSTIFLSIYLLFLVL